MGQQCNKQVDILMSKHQALQNVIPYIIIIYSVILNSTKHKIPLQKATWFPSGGKNKQNPTIVYYVTKN